MTITHSAGKFHILILTCCLMGCTKKPRPPVGGALSPEAAISEFFTAIAENKPNEACKLLVEPVKMAEYCRGQARVSAAFRSLAEEKASRFGESDAPIESQIPALVSLERLSQIAPIEDGDNATWPANPKSPMKLIRTDGLWKIHLSDTYQDSSQLNAVVSLFHGTAEFVSEIANEISEGKYASLEEVQSELQLQNQLLNARLGG
ncbi:MAG: hypothetical protein AAF802_19080 [Planctomycetota bacterium]